MACVCALGGVVHRVYCGPMLCVACSVTTEATCGMLLTDNMGIHTGPVSDLGCGDLFQVIELGTFTMSIGAKQASPPA